MSDKEHNLESLFEAAAEIEGPAERQAFLDEACDGDAELRKQVEKLLASDMHAGSFLERPPAELDITIVPDHSASNQNSEDSSKSMLLTMGFAGEPPRVSLRDTADEGDGPIERPGSSEIPRQETGSRYQLQGEIARGGMGVIVKGRDNDLGRELAIKVLVEEHKANPQVIQRFVEEAQIGGQLQHPGIAPVYELGQFADQRPFFSMKLIKGKTLAALLEERADVSGDRTKLLNTFEQICQTMAYAHSRGVIHRDPKPANIMVGAFGEVQVMDWGLAKVLGAGGIEDEKKANTRHRMEEPSETLIHTARDVGSNLPERFGSTGSDTMMGSVMGTPAYMPPEQALGELDRVDERADVFGLGAILCEILTGKPPYVADSGAEVFRRARRGQLNECLDRLDASSDEKELVSIAKQAIAAETEKRLRNASVLADRIAKYLAGVQERLKQAELSQAKEHERAEHATRRRRLLSVFAGLMLVVAIAAGFAAVEFRRQREANAELAEQNEARRKEVETEKAKVEQEKNRVQQYSKRLEEEREALRQEQYLSDMLLAQQAHESGDVGRARKLLLKYVPVDGETDRRTFDWYYWWRSTHLESTSVQLQDQAVMSMAVSPDQRFVATTGIGGELEIRNAKTLARLAFFEPEGRSGQALNVMMRLSGGLKANVLQARLTR